MHPHPSPAEHEELVERLSAYLDGELDSEGTRQVEDLLAADAQARDTLRRLERAWDLLERLPRSEVPASFTQTTVEMVALRAGAELDEQSAPGRRRRAWVWTGMVGAALAAVVVGYYATTLFWPDPNQQLLRDLEVIERAEAYRLAESIDFLRQLQARGLFLPPGWQPAAAVPETPQQRRQRIEQLSPAEKEQLRNKQQRFQELSLEERQRLIAFDQQVAADPAAAQLSAVLEGYHAWLAKMPAVARAELLALEPGRRIERIQQLHDEEQRRLARQLSPQDLKVVAAWLESRVLDNTPPNVKQWMEKLPDAERRRAIGLRLWERGRSFEFAKQMGPLKEHDIQELLGRLSPEAREQLERANTPFARMGLLGDWMRQALGAGYASSQPGVSEDDLLRFLESLPESDRAALLALPTDEFQQAIRRLHYLRSAGPALQPPLARPPEGPGQPGRFRPRRDPDDRPPPDNRPKP